MLGCLAVGIGGTGIAYPLAATLAGRVGAVRLWALAGTAVVLVGAYFGSRLDEVG